MNMAFYQESSTILASIEEIRQENRDLLRRYVEAAKVDPDKASIQLGVPASILRRLSTLTPEQIDMLANGRESRVKIDVEKLRMLLELAVPDTVQKDRTFNQIEMLNFRGLIKRWASARHDLEWTAVHFNITPDLIERIARLSLHQIEYIATIGHSLFQLNLDDGLLDIVAIASTPKELSRLGVLRG